MEEVKEKSAAASEIKDNTEEVFMINRPTLSTNINVVGKIDLDALNQQTRPKKKTKEEKRKEREAKEKQRSDLKKPVVAGDASGQSEGERRKRKRINKEKVDIEKSVSDQKNQPRPNNVGNNRNNNGVNNGNNRNNGGGNNKSRLKRPVIKAEISDEDVQKQIKETLARLTTKGQKKSAKWRKEKREAFSNREREMAEQEMAESHTLKLTEFVTANDLAVMMNVPVNNVISTCMSIV